MAKNLDNIPSPDDPRYTINRETGEVRKTSSRTIQVYSEAPAGTRTRRGRVLPGTKLETSVTEIDVSQEMPDISKTIAATRERVDTLERRLREAPLISDRLGMWLWLTGLSEEERAEVQYLPGTVQQSLSLLKTMNVETDEQFTTTIAELEERFEDIKTRFSLDQIRRQAATVTNEE